MWGVISTAFLVLYVLMSFYIGRRGWIKLVRTASGINKKIYLAILAILVLFFPASSAVKGFLPEAGRLVMTVWGYYSMLAILYIFLLLLAIDLICLLDKCIGFIPAVVGENRKTPHVLGIMVIIFAAAILAYGSWNARNPLVTEYRADVNKQAGALKELSIVMVSDIHYGEIIDVRRLDNMVGIIERLRPDVILLDGDIVEGTPKREDMVKLAGILGSMQARFGKYAVPGNHDRGLRDSGSELSRGFEEAGVNILRDKYIEIENSFYIIGRDEQGRQNNGQGRKELSDLIKGIDAGKPLILLDHQPSDIEKAKNAGIDLQLSGHTHGGQIFPFTLVTGQIYELNRGLLTRGSYNLIVSSGYGTWGPPLRIGSSPEVVHISVKFNK